MDDRAVAPVVGKALESGLVLLYVALVASTLFGTVVPDYRTTAGDAVADRALAAAASDVETAIPVAVRSATVRHRVSLPKTIRGTPYVVRAENRTLVLDHPNPGVSGRVRLVLPAAVERVQGAWQSDRPAILVVRRTNGSVVVTLEAGR